MKACFCKALFLATLFISIILVGCSSNTQSENTGVGAVTGAVVGGIAGSFIGAGAGQAVAIGVGAVVGGVIGGLIGHNMDSTDNAKVDNAMSNNQTNHPTRWKNNKTGATYTVAPTSDRMTLNGNPNCRRFYTTAMINGKKQKVSGVACKQSDGTWRTVNA